MVHRDDSTDRTGHTAGPTQQPTRAGTATTRVADFLAAARANDGVARIPLSWATAARFSHAPGARLLVVLFHGAVDRSKRTPPVFHGLLPLPFPAHQLSVFDSALERDGSHGLAWYAGHEDFDMQTELTAFVDELRHGLEVERVVFCGSSGGGFAALQQSWEMPGSVALVGQPQTHLLRYHEVHVRRYIEACWPSLTSPEELAEHRTIDLCTRYAEDVPNTVIYLQSIGDRFHLVHHMAPFVSAFESHLDAPVVVECGYWGSWGHTDSIGLAPFVEWARAIEVAVDLDAETLLATRDRLRRAERDDPVDTMMRAMLRAQAVDGDPGDRDGDLAIAELVRDHHLAWER